MKINKYIEKLENNGFEVDVNQDSDKSIQLRVYYDGHEQLIAFIGPNDARQLSSNANNIPLGKYIDLLTITKTLFEIPDDILFAEPKYRVRLVGFNSENGKQYLTTEYDDIANPLGHKFFACAPHKGLKQEFTLDELTAIANKREFKAVPWIQDLLRNTELVEDE